MSAPNVVGFGLHLYWREQLFRWRDMGTMARMETMKALYRAPQ